MKLTAFPKTISCLALLLCLGSFAPPATADHVAGEDRHDQWIVIESQSAPQTVDVHTPRDSYNAVFQSAIQVFPDGTANGFLTLTPTDRHSGGANFAFSDGSVRFIRDSIVPVVLLRGLTQQGNPIVVMITPGASQDCLIYTTVGSDVHATWEAQGQIVVTPR
jgi:prepilin-type processing-associated H-X9-DG protein